VGVYESMKFPIKTVSEANQREHWAVRGKRKTKQQRDFSLLFRQWRPAITLPATIRFTRFSIKLMDSDNLAGSFKHVRDQLAKEIGIDDGSPLIRFEYAQEQIPKRDHYFTVEIG
jgi:hypothetical protein